MARADLRFDHSPITIEHASARGKIQRNAGSYTRGAGLIGQNLSLWRNGTKMPFYIWLGLLVVITWTMMSAIMGDHEIQLCSWRIGSALWTWMDLDPFKPMNIILTDGTLRKTSIGYIPYLPDVQIAWAKAEKTLLGSFLAACIIAFPAVSLYVRLANKLGSRIMEEHHERGATLVTRDILCTLIVGYNREKFKEAAAKLFPKMTLKQVGAIPFEQLKAAGLHHPYSLGGLPYPYKLEASHAIVIGTTGSGKTTQLRALTKQIRERQDSAVIFDLTGDFVKAFYNPETDTILNPGDARCPTWSLFNECSTEAEFTAASHAIVPHDGGGGDPFWITSARGLFVQTCLKLEEMGETTNQALAKHLMMASLEHITALLSDTIASPYTSAEAGKLAQSVRSVFNANAQAFMSLPTGGPDFSISEWIRKPDKPGSILFVTARYVDMALYKMLLTLWLDVAANTLMTLPRLGELRTWFLFDELGALHRLPAIENGLQTARGYGGAIVLGLHSFARLQAVYGKEGAENLTSLARTKLVLATADRNTAEQCSEFIGYREVRQMDEAYAYSANSHRDVATLTPRKEIAPLVIPDDITNLPSLHGFIKFPDGFPAARVVLKWEDYPTVANDFEPRDDLKPRGPTPSRPRPSEPPNQEGASEKRAVEVVHAAARQPAAEDRAAPVEVVDAGTSEDASTSAAGTVAEEGADEAVKDVSKKDEGDSRTRHIEQAKAQIEPEEHSLKLDTPKPQTDSVPLLDQRNVPEQVSPALQQSAKSLSASFDVVQDLNAGVAANPSGQFGDGTDNPIDSIPGEPALSLTPNEVSPGRTVANDNAMTKSAKLIEDPTAGIMRYEVTNDFAGDHLPKPKRHLALDDEMEL